MSAVVTQLSFNINEKLRIDDRNYPSYQQHHKQEASQSANKTITSFSYTPKDSCTQWVPSTPTGGGYPSPNAPAAPGPQTTSLLTDHTLGSSGTVVGVACPRVPQLQAQTSRVGSARVRRDPLPVSSLRTTSHTAETTQVTLFELQQREQRSAPGASRATLSALHGARTGKVPVPRTTSVSVDLDNPFQFTGSSFAKTQRPDSFPSVVGKSCTLHSPKKPPGFLHPPTTSSSSSSASSMMSDIPPVKRHCRSVSEPDELLLDPLSSSCGLPSRVWVPIRRLHQHHSRRAHSSYSATSSSQGDCSRSLDCSSVASVPGESLLTPPASPVPRPASVTVIKQESGSWTFLSSQHPKSTSSAFQPQPCGFSPLTSPFGNVTSPGSARSAEAGGERAWGHGGLAATKRSLSFSDDFEHRESIHYTPSSTPDLERRFEHGTSRYGGLLRCQSHPSDLNARRTRSSRRRASKLCYQRPTLDFVKMKQTFMGKRSSAKETPSTSKHEGMAPPAVWSATPSVTDRGKVPTVRPVFPSAVGTGECSNAQGQLRHNTIEQHSSPPTPTTFMFTVAPAPMMSHIRDVRGRIPSPTDELPGESDDVMDLTTATGGDVIQPFVPECEDLDVDEIENESGDEI